MPIVFAIYFKSIFFFIIINYVTYQYATLSKPCTGKDASRVPSISDSDSETPRHHPQSRRQPSPSMNEPSWSNAQGLA